MFLVAADIVAELRVPEDLVGLRRGRLRTLLGLHKFASVPLPAVMMPEAPADLDQRLQARQHDIGMSDNPLVADAKPVTVRVQPLSDDHLGQRISALHRLHAPAPLFWSKLIHARHSALVSFRRRVDTRGAGGGRTAPDALAAAVSVAMKLIRRIDAAVSVTGRAAPLAVFLVVDVLVNLLRTVDTAVSVTGRAAMSAFRTHVKSPYPPLYHKQLSRGAWHSTTTAALPPCYSTTLTPPLGSDPSGTPSHLTTGLHSKPVLAPGDSVTVSMSADLYVMTLLQTASMSLIDRRRRRRMLRFGNIIYNDFLWHLAEIAY